jgi:hypothetical protein
MSMGLMQFLFGTKKAPAAAHSRLHSQYPSGGLSQGHSTSGGGSRRELLRVALRDTLNRHGIPASWISAEVFATSSRTGERGVQWRLIVKHWDPRLLACSIALQNALIKRAISFDPLATNWLTGISWQFQLEDESKCPALPHPGTWTATPHTPHSAKPVAPAAVKGIDVIEGPVRIEEAKQQPKEADARADLDQLLAIRDADFQRHASSGQTWTATEPAKL